MLCCIVQLPLELGRWRSSRSNVDLLRSSEPTWRYGRLTGADEEGTLDRLRALRREVIDPAIAAQPAPAGLRLVHRGFRRADLKEAKALLEELS
jgi:hypothetical protein